MGEPVVIVASSPNIEITKAGPGPDIQVKVMPPPGTPPQQGG